MFSPLNPQIPAVVAIFRQCIAERRRMCVADFVRQCDGRSIRLRIVLRAPDVGPVIKADQPAGIGFLQPQAVDARIVLRDVVGRNQRIPELQGHLRP